MEKQKIIYREIQKPRQFWLWALVLLIAALAWYGFIQQIIFGIPFGNNPAPDAVLVVYWLVFGIVFPLVMLKFLQLITEVRDDGLYIRFLPFHIRYRRILLEDIEDYQPIVYNSLLLFGGWGIRMNFRGDIAYNIGGNQGIELKLKHKKVIIVGTKRPEELVKVLDSIKGTR